MAARVQYPSTVINFSEKTPLFKLARLVTVFQPVEIYQCKIADKSLFYCSILPCRPHSQGDRMASFPWSGDGQFGRVELQLVQSFHHRPLKVRSWLSSEALDLIHNSIRGIDLLQDIYCQTCDCNSERCRKMVEAEILEKFIKGGCNFKKREILLEVEAISTHWNESPNGNLLPLH